MTGAKPLQVQYALADGFRARAETFVGRDAFFEIKRDLDPRYPEYAYEIIRLTDVVSDGNFSAWRNDGAAQ